MDDIIEAKKMEERDTNAWFYEVVGLYLDSKEHSEAITRIMDFL
jgi:hypothetical protein